MTREIAVEFARKNIRANSLCPGPVETRMIQSVTDQVQPGHADEVAKRYKGAIPLGRFALSRHILDASHDAC